MKYSAQKVQVLYIKSGNLKLGWWIGLITGAGGKRPPITCEPNDPFWALYLPDFIIRLWWGIN